MHRRIFDHITVARETITLTGKGEEMGEDDGWVGTVRQLHIK